MAGTNCAEDRVALGWPVKAPGSAQDARSGRFSDTFALCMTCWAPVRSSTAIGHVKLGNLQAELYLKLINSKLKLIIY